MKGGTKRERRDGFMNQLNEQGFFKKMPSFRKIRGHYGKTPRRRADLDPSERWSKTSFLLRLRGLEAEDARQEIETALQGNRNDESFSGSSLVREVRYLRRASEPDSIPFRAFIDGRLELEMRRCAAASCQIQKARKQRRSRWGHLWHCLGIIVRR